MTVRPEPLTEAALQETEISFAPSTVGSKAGTLDYSIDPRFTGGYWVEIDVDGDGDYTGPLDRREQLGADGAGAYSYDFDGRDSAGDAIDSCQPSNARIYFDRVGEVHVVQDDVEGRTGGISITRLNGPNSPNSTIYWDDTKLTNVPPAANSTPDRDGSAGVNSAVGVHGWAFNNNSWGNERSIEDWTYLPLDLGAAQTSLATASSDCLALTKSSDATADSRVGDTITYSVRATNIGAADFTAENPAVVRDDLAGVIDDATYDNDATSDLPGASAYAASELNWSGALPAGDTVTLTYTVTLKPGGDGDVRNVAFAPKTGVESPPVPACDPADSDGTDPVTGDPCAAVEFLVPKLNITKVADRETIPAVGEQVTYTVTATNIGPGTYTTDAPAYVVDDLTNVLDDATIDADSLESDRGDAATYTAPKIAWSGALMPGQSVNISYTVTYTGSGDTDLVNIAFGPTTPETRTPACNPPVAGVDPSTGLPCAIVSVPGALLDVSKSVSSSTAEVAAGTVLTYTVTFVNRGAAAADVATSDNLTQVLDDAELSSGPVSSSADLTTTATVDGIFSMGGTVAPGATETVSYAVTVKPDGSRGDNIAANFLVPDPNTPVPPVTACEAGHQDCTSTPIGEIVSSKSVASSTTVIGADTILTYTLSFTNTGNAAAAVIKSDNLTGVLDDAVLTTEPTSTGAALTLTTVTDGIFSVSGSLEPGQAETVTYTATVKADGSRGDNVAANFLLAGPTEQPPTVCETGSTQCTSTEIAEIVTAKSVDPESGATVVAGQVLTYALTFQNTGAAAGAVDSEDILTGVLDDAALTSTPVASDDALVVSAVENGKFTVVGTVAAGATATVTYTVTVKADGLLGDNILGNFLVKTGEEPPAECSTDSTLCTSNPVPRIETWKTADPVSATPVVGGQEISYTLHFSNTGAAAGEVDKVDDLSQAIDDATVATAPVVSDAALAVSEVDDAGRFSVVGPLQPGQIVTVGYTLRVKDEASRGDSILANFLLNPSEPPVTDPSCVVTNEERPNCTNHPVSNLLVTKAVDPMSGSTVKAGQQIDYTLTFTNVGQGAAGVDYTDDMAGVLDDATVVRSPKADSSALTASSITDGEFTVTGAIRADQTVTVRYSVVVKAYVDQGDHLLGNFLVLTGVTPPTNCVAENPLCTLNPAPVLQENALPDTGFAVMVPVLGGLGLLLAGVGVAIARRRNEAV